MRINQVEYHPAYHELMKIAIENEVPSFAWNHAGPVAQVVHAALTYLFNQPEGGVMVGEEGRGIRTIIDMVQGNRIYCTISSASLMRQGLVQALHHTTHRSAFQKRLVQQPLMRNVLADLALESEAALVLGLRIARALDEVDTDESAAALARIGAVVGKYWNCKRAPGHVFEALECHGGPGYIEESIMPRLYREAPVNSIWEGSGNVVCLDVLRAMRREKAVLPALFAELDAARGSSAALDAAAAKLKRELETPDDLEPRARDITERMALTLQGALLIRHAPPALPTPSAPPASGTATR